MPDDFKANVRTAGSVAVGGSATGEIEKKNDIDWFAVELVAGRTYVIDLEGSPTGGGTLANPLLRGLYGGGGRIASTRNDNGGEGANARLTFTATESGTYYIAARGQGRDIGSYTVRVTESVDADATADGATRLGDLAMLDGKEVHKGKVDGAADKVDYYHLTLSEDTQLRLGLKKLDADADLYLEDADGNVLHSSTNGGTRKESIEETLEAGTYYIRVAAQEEGDNSYTLTYEPQIREPVLEPEPEPLVKQEPEVDLQPQQRVSEKGPQNDLPADISTSGRVLTDGQAVQGQINDPNNVVDRDWFKVTLTAGQTYKIDMFGGTLEDPYLRGVYDADGNYIAHKGARDGGGGKNDRAFFTPDASGDYFVAVGGVRSGPCDYKDDFSYNLSVIGVNGIPSDGIVMIDV